LIDKTVAGEREKFTGFLIESVNKVFTSPTDKVFDSPHKDSGQTDKALKQVASMVKTVARSLKH
jgi:chemotaxis signal transduction protein